MSVLMGGSTNFVYFISYFGGSKYRNTELTVPALFTTIADVKAAQAAIEKANSFAAGTVVIMNYVLLRTVAPPAAALDNRVIRRARG